MRRSERIVRIFQAKRDMTDVLTPMQRARCMASIRSKGTKPEIALQGILRELGIRYRKQVRTLPGKPDFTVGRLKLAIFVHGCFWHRHNCRLGRAMPSTNAAFWANKFVANQRRDRAARNTLKLLGWRVITVWECQTKPKRIAALKVRIRQQLRV